MPFEPRPLNTETLRQLLNEATERAGLDYKSECDLSERASLVEVIKDIGAMQIRGGYIVVGADDHGQPTGKLSEKQAKLFDQATLHDKVAKYLWEGFDVRSNWLELDGNFFGLVCVLPHADGWSPFKADGTYVADPKTGKQKTAFCAGDTFGRHGSKSEPLNQDDVREILAEIRRQERERARSEVHDVVVELGRTAGAAQNVASAPASALTWRLDSETMIGAAIEQIRHNDLIPLRRLLKSLPRDATALMEAGEADQLDTLLDQLACLLATSIDLERDDLARSSVDALGAIYNATFDVHGSHNPRLKIDAHDVRLAVITRAIACGALAVRERQWDVAHALATVPPAADPGYWQNWLFHGEVDAARAGRLEDAQFPRIGQSPLVFAQEHIVRMECLRPDVVAEDEQVVTSLCQFDILAGFAAVAGTSRRFDPPYLAQFARWFAERTDPVVVEMIEGGPMRETFFPGDDEELAGALRALAHNASQMAGLIHGWHGYEDQRILDFLVKHPEPQPGEA
jgi:hypothetical protein